MITKGSRVLIPGKESAGTVLNIRDNFAEVSLDSQVYWHPIDELTDISDRLMSRLVEGDMDGPLKFILAADANRLMTKYGFDPYVLASSTKISIYPHQIDEVMWGLDNPRIMIADEVGLGKTIIAALISSELKARGLADRVLYVVPKTLVLKWKEELQTRFDTEVTVLDGDYVKFNGEPFLADKYDYVTSMDFLKQENRRRLIHKLDLVVVDEAHKFKPDNERYGLGRILSEQAGGMIFLTATPHDGKDENFLGRMALLDPFVTDVVSTSHLWMRHRKEDVVDLDGKQVFPDRTSTTVDTELTNDERRIHNMLDEYINERRAEARTSQDLGAVRFLGTILKKRATSSPYSLRSTLERRMEKLGTAGNQKTVDPDDIENEGDYEDRAEKYEYVWTGGNIEQEKNALSDMIKVLDGIGKDSKLDTLMEFIGKVKSGDSKAKILLFTEYRDTVDYLEGRLEGKYRTGRIDGTMDIMERKEALEKFARADGPDIFLCTDAAGEGVDMQFCNVEFNYDIPWNPNRLEQRMGRIHRIGQKRKVRYYNFVVDRENTIDGMIHGMLLDKIESIKTALGDDSIFDILGRIIAEDMIRKIYEELQGLPHEMWKPKIMAALEEIERTREDMKQKTGLLQAGKRLDRTMLENLRDIKMRSVDASDVRRFLETWTESNDGTYTERDNCVTIIAPRHIASKIGGILRGTLDVDLAMERNLEYLALGNKKVQVMLEDAIGDGRVASLSHEKKSGVLCVYNRSVVDGDGHKRNSETVMVFCNEDGTAEMVDVDSVWDYEENGPEDAAPPNTELLSKLKELADKKIYDDSQKFHELTAEKLDTMRRKARSVVDMHVAAEIERHDERIAEYEAKRHTAPRYTKMINDAKNKSRRKAEEGEKRKAEMDRRLKSHLIVDMVGLATVTPKAGANARTMSDRAGMEIVLEYERRRAKTDSEREQVRDVHDRDKGYDIETSDRSIEVKSFEGYPNPSLTSHEWNTAGKFGDRYWLYVVENVHSGGNVTEIQNPQEKLGGMVTEEVVTTHRYSFNWAEWKRMSGSANKDA